MSVKRCVVKINYLILKSLKSPRGILVLACWAFILFIAVSYLIVLLNNDPYKVDKPYIYIEPLSSYFRFKHGQEKRDWHDLVQIERESKRSGPGKSSLVPKFPPNKTLT